MVSRTSNGSLPTAVRGVRLDVRADPVLRELGIVQRQHSRAVVKMRKASPGTIEYGKVSRDVHDLSDALRQLQRGLEERPWTEI